MVKRGGGFNATGAVNWEWYELNNNADGSVVTVARLRAPGGFGGHLRRQSRRLQQLPRKAAANDYVWSAALQLSDL